ncbi:beta-1,4-glucuronyltransferase 1-like [Oratosquilla oratoria]|uniref:beta-1,4-glucuronyltransferase 1-like n=1 Tax=Oratosquilla oratoria TaxID=337810 RepID=UPI003F771B90
MKWMLDKSKSFKTHRHVVTGDLWRKKSHSRKTCLSTQVSADLLFNVARQAETWTGPISVAVFVPAEDYTVAFLMMHYLRTCFPSVRERVTFHMTYPTDLPPKLLDNKRLQLHHHGEPKGINRYIVRKIRTGRLHRKLKSLSYPQNLLRNEARTGCQSEFVFTPDADMIATPHLFENLEEFLGGRFAETCDKCAFVIPVYEISAEVERNPRNKDELLSFLKTGLARPFHVAVYSPNQANSHLDRWESEGAETELQVLYNITTWMEKWEPVYVARAPVPNFDERFVGYGFTRNTQVYEMHLDGYTWHMLNNAFLNHRGFQTNQTYSKARWKQIQINSDKYRQEHIWGPVQSLAGGRKDGGTMILVQAQSEGSLHVPRRARVKEMEDPFKLDLGRSLLTSCIFVSPLRHTYSSCVTAGVFLFKTPMKSDSLHDSNNQEPQINYHHRSSSQTHDGRQP